MRTLAPVNGKAEDKTLILVQCRDAVGLVSRIAHVLAARDLNITAMREFVDEDRQQFFARITCSTGTAGASGETVQGTADGTELLNDLRQALPAGAWVRLNPRLEKKVAVLVTREY